MTNILEQLKLGTANVRLIDFPGTTRKVALRVLSIAERQEAVFSTERHFKAEKIETSMVTANEYDAEVATQMLFRALRDPEKLTDAICPTLIQFRQLISRDEREMLMDSYLAFEKEVSPTPETLSGDEFDRVVSELKKKQDITILNSLSIHTLRKLVLILVAPVPS